ncbi:hypothetical protein M5K25_020599 [Dendrobium thyrsiflorum]|uniref:Uncharacterized protein n=1 Tax=Dendrobium thyrsiflorum TaxID=117978 RepID=A0ABD0UAG7_DENTH
MWLLGIHKDPISTAIFLNITKIHYPALKADGGGSDDGPDQDPIVLTSQDIMVSGLLSYRRPLGGILSICEPLRLKFSTNTAVIKVFISDFTCLLNIIDFVYLQTEDQTTIFVAHLPHSICEHIIAYSPATINMQLVVYIIGPLSSKLVDK